MPSNVTREKRFPNLFVVGAPKCGTTAISRYLSSHPQIFMSEQAGCKEPEYFATDFHFSLSPVSSEADYLALFENASPEIRYLGEASVSYLCSQVAVKRILAVSPQAKLIVMVRNPVELAQSLHNQQVRSGGETVLDFERAWRLQEVRGRSGKTLSSRADPRVLQYGDLAKIGGQLARLYEVAPKKQVRVGLFDDLATDTEREYRALLAFLELPFDENVRLSVINPSVGYRSSSLQRWMVRIRNLRVQLGIRGGWGVNKTIDRFNTRPDKIPLSPGFRKELQEYFREDVELLSRIMDRDLSRWLKP